MATDRSLGDLAKDAATHLGDMVKNEIRLAKTEAAEGVKTLSGGLAVMIIGAAVGAAALTLGLFALAYGLAETMPMWQACLASAAIGAAAALVLLLAGRAAMKPKDLALPRTREQVSRDVDAVAEQVTQ